MACAMIITMRVFCGERMTSNETVHSGHLNVNNFNSHKSLTFQFNMFITLTIYQNNSIKARDILKNGKILKLFLKQLYFYYARYISLSMIHLKMHVEYKGYLKNSKILKLFIKYRKIQSILYSLFKIFLFFFFAIFCK